MHGLKILLFPFWCSLMALSSVICVSIDIVCVHINVNNMIFHIYI